MTPVHAQGQGSAAHQSNTAPLLEDNKQQELTSSTLETPLPSDAQPGQPWPAVQDGQKQWVRLFVQQWTWGAGAGLHSGLGEQAQGFEQVVVVGHTTEAVHALSQSVPTSHRLAQSPAVEWQHCALQSEGWQCRRQMRSQWTRASHSSPGLELLVAE